MLINYLVVLTCLITCLENNPNFVLLTSIHDQIPSDFGLPVIPRCFKTLSEANAEVLEVTFAHQGLRGAGGDQRAFDGQDQC